eukprot:1397233-Amphidinium_carterae.1
MQKTFQHATSTVTYGFIHSLAEARELAAVKTTAGQILRQSDGRTDYGGNQSVQGAFKKQPLGQRRQKAMKSSTEGVWRLACCLIQTCESSHHLSRSCAQTN